MIDGLVAGRLMGEASRRVDKAGRGYIVARVLARNRADEEFIVNVIAFDEAAGQALVALRDGESLTLSGGLTPKVWTDKQGVVRASLDLVATHVLTAHQAGGA
ncbi:single-stranded DNA-binding protein [Hydrogenophaga laconesensis]|uniref:Single-stranded DNA-binding protein n=1 Tax=Hydrogenophaga laconesensis TaxID=1805971 RepID=A0ABU1VCY3_9BURK|nr:single-stranded DNA-binding protein [Hydrogenophaga laconesensis]MDR7095329.1 single-stranded DNA-binding protein [Hydrogenophaga laconesensis]